LVLYISSMEPITSNMIGDFTDVGLVGSGDGGLKGGKFARLPLVKDLNYVVGKGGLIPDNDVEASELGEVACSRSAVRSRLTARLNASSSRRRFYTLLTRLEYRG
jgi:hypothetical protein